MAANDIKSYLGYFNKLVSHSKNTYCRSMGKKAVDVDYSTLTKEIESSHKAHKLVTESGLLNTKVF